MTEISKLEANIFGVRSFSVDEDEFDRACHAIEREYVRRGLWTRAEAASLHEDSHHVWLRRFAYALVRRLIRQGDTELLFDRIKRHRPSQRGRDGNPNIFQSGLKAIFAHRPVNLNPRDQERFGEQLMFAFKHFVPPPFLEGFLHQTHAHRKASEEIAPLFVDWIDEGWDRMTEDEDDFSREFLPDIRRQIKKIEKERKRRSKPENRIWPG
ncbi:hypothetical protein [Sphingopyxis sp. L1A2A]|uniref:hypothetical protein n=1 Tax=Sphingopyxis sp. L1A2A TaxID=2502247 RepID=UPI0010F9D273|nr:hypothetical protein [Sphingopyxis sp. L1A2A]